jgi:hypothetical protein
VKISGANEQSVRCEKKREAFFLGLKKRRRVRMKAKSVLTISFILLLVSLSFSQSRDTGAILGKVTDDQKTPLPGVNVTLTGRNLMGGRSAVTDDKGDFRFPALPPGEYSLKAVLLGFKTVIQENIRLTTTMSLTINMVMAQTAVAEQVTVVAKSPVVDIKSTETASVTLTNEVLRNIPYSQFTADIVNMAPGVNNDIAYGAGSGRGISWQMDGVGVGDPDGGTAWVFLDHNIIEEAKVMGVGLPAEYGNFTGVIFNVITKSGSNQFSGHFEFDFQGRKTRGSDKGDWPGSLWGTENNQAYAADFPAITSPMEKLMDANVHLGGPITKDKLWFYAGVQWYNSQDWVTGFPYARNYKQPRGFLKLTSQLTNKTNINFSVEYDNYNGTYRGASATVSPEATVNQIDPEMVANFSLTHIFNQSTFFDLKISGFSGYYDLEPRTGRNTNGHYYENANPARPDRRPLTRYDSSGYWAEHPRARIQLNASLTHYAEDFIKGDHDFKFGVELERSVSRNKYGYTGANHMYYSDYWGGGYTGNYLAYQYEGYNINTRLVRLEAFAQDNWHISDRLNISLGLRLSQNWGTVKDVSGVLYNTTRLAPRIGFTFDIFGDKTTVLKAHFGQFTDGMYAGIFDRMNPQWSDKIFYAWDLGTQSWQEYKRNVHGTWSVDGGVKHPYMDQVMAGLERELFKDASISITYIYRSYHNFVVPYNKLATYNPTTVHVPAPYNQDFTLYSLTSGTAADWHITNLENLTNLFADTLGFTFNPYRKYSGLEILFTKRFSSNWQLMLSYVYSKTWGTVNNSGSAYTDIGWGDFRYGPDPNIWINADGRMSADPTHQIKAQGTYVLPFGIQLNAYFRALSGDTWTARYRSRVYGTGGRVTFFIEPRGSQRYPMEKTLDLRLEKTFTFGAKYRLGVLFDVFNVFNDVVINSWGTRIGYDWYAASTYPSTQGHELYGLGLPRRARVGIRLIF